MNKRLSEFAKACIKEDLAKCTEPQQNMFKRIYGALDMEMDYIVDTIPDDELNLVMNLIERTLRKNEKDQK